MKKLTILIFMLFGFRGFSSPKPPSIPSSTNFNDFLLAPETRSRIKKLSQDTYWNALVYYEKRSMFKGVESLADGKNFFFAKKGKVNPQEELKATIENFLDPKAKWTHIKMHPQCAFPERFKFIRKKFPNLRFPQVICNDFLEWKKSLDTKSISVLFSTAYAASAGSIFGHTLLKLNKYDPKTPHLNLLNYVAGFGANTNPDDNFVFYALKGIFGTYPGLFSLNPYYIKIKEYGHVESRDIWEYELNLNPDQVDSIVNHLWELYANTHFDYYFFDENCSYFIGKLLDIGVPEFRENQDYKFFTLPTDIVKRITRNPQVIKNVYQWPGRKQQFFAHFESLDEEDKLSFNRLLKGEYSPEKENFGPLLAAAKYLDYKKWKNKNGLEKKTEKLYDNILLALSKKDGKSKPNKNLKPRIEHTNRPDMAQSPTRVGIWPAVEKGDFSLGLEIKGVFQDLLDNDNGFARFNQIDLMRMRGAYQPNEKKFYIDELKILDIYALPNFRWVDPTFSYAIGVGFDALRDLGKKRSHQLEIEGGAGFSPHFWDKSSMFYLLGGGFIGLSPHFKRNFRAGLQFKSALISQVTPWLKVGAEVKLRLAQFRGGIFEVPILTGGLMSAFHINKKFQVRARLDYGGKEGAMILGDSKVSLGGLYYF